MAQTLDEIRALNIEKKVWKLRRKGISWTEISKEINQEFNQEFKTTKIQEIYDTYAARQTAVASTTKNGKVEANKVAGEFNDEMKVMLESVRSKAQKHLDIADELLIDQYNAGNSKAYFRNLPVAISLFRAVLDQINVLDRRLEKISITQNNLILNETQIIQLVNKSFEQKEKETGMVVHPGTGQLIVVDERKIKNKK